MTPSFILMVYFKDQFSFIAYILVGVKGKSCSFPALNVPAALRAFFGKFYFQPFFVYTVINCVANSHPLVY
jgi:hypothetical protein